MAALGVAIAVRVGRLPVQRKGHGIERGFGRLYAHAVRQPHHHAKHFEIAVVQRIAGEFRRQERTARHRHKQVRGNERPHPLIVWRRNANDGGRLAVQPDLAPHGSRV